MVMLYVGLQYPNWKRSFGLTDGAGWILMAAYMLLVTVTSLLGMLLYTYVSRKPERVTAVRKIIYGFVIALILPIIVNTFKTGNVLDSITGWLSHDYIKFIPLLGWFREILMGVFTGVTTEIWLYILFTLVITIAAFVRIYLMDTDYYENVLAGTELKEAMLQASRQGKAAQSNGQFKAIRRYRKVDAKFTLEGSLAIFQKQILEKRKKGFLLLPTRTIIMAVGAAIAALAIPVDGTELMLGILGVSAYLMLILSAATAWESDIAYHYIYLIPATPFKKMLASTLAGVIYTFIEGILIFGIIGGHIEDGSFPYPFSHIGVYSYRNGVFILRSGRQADVWKDSRKHPADILSYLPAHGHHFYCCNSCSNDFYGNRQLCPGTLYFSGGQCCSDSALYVDRDRPV